MIAFPSTVAFPSALVRFSRPVRSVSVCPLNCSFADSLLVVFELRPPVDWSIFSFFSFVVFVSRPTSTPGRRHSTLTARRRPRLTVLRQVPR